MFKTKKVGFKGLIKQLHELEARYGMNSAEFYKKFLAKEFDHANDDEFVFWAGLYEMYLRLAPDDSQGKHSFSRARKLAER